MSFAYLIQLPQQGNNPDFMSSNVSQSEKCSKKVGTLVQETSKLWKPCSIIFVCKKCFKKSLHNIVLKVLKVGSKYLCSCTSKTYCTSMHELSLKKDYRFINTHETCSVIKLHPHTEVCWGVNFENEVQMRFKFDLCHLGT